MWGRQLKVAFIHGLYGEDFVQEAILSIVDQVDLVLFLWADKPWYGIERVKLPYETDAPVHSPVDNMLFRAMQLDHPKVRFIKFNPPGDVFSMHYAARHLIPRETEILIHTNGVDVIQHPDGITRAIAELEAHKVPVGVMSQRWTWKDLRYECVMNSRPSGSILYDMRRIGWEDLALKEAFQEEQVRIAMFERTWARRLLATCWNVGFALNTWTMMWRVAIREAQVTAGLNYQLEKGGWFNRWASWKPGENDRVARYYSRDVNEIVPLDPSELPPLLQARVV